MAKVSNISMVTYRAWDPEKSFDFFTDLLGFYPARRGSKILVGLDETLIEFIPAEPGDEDLPKTQHGYVFGVEVDNIDKVVEELESHGIAMIRPIWSAHSFWGRQAVVDVPGGPPIALREWRAPDGPHFDGWHPEEPTA